MSKHPIHSNKNELVIYTHYIRNYLKGHLIE